MKKPEFNLALYSRHFHNPSRRGVAIYTHELVKALSNLLAHTSVYLIDCFWPHLNFSFLPQINNPNFETKVLRCPGRLFDFLNNNLGWPRLEGLVKNVEVLHVLHEQVPNTKIKNVLMTVHGLGPLLYPHLHSDHFRRNWTDSLVKGLEKATKVVTVSTSVEKQLRQYFPEYASKYVTTFLGVSRPFLATSNPQREQAYILSKNIHFPYILYVGAADPGKNLIKLLEAFSLFISTIRPRPPHHLIIAGNPNWGGYNQAQDKISALPVKDRIHFTGYIEHLDLPALYRGCDLFVFPSLFEGFGLPVLEAMAAGAPCLVSERPALTEVGADIAEYCNPESAENIASKLKSLIDNPEKLSEMRHKGKQYAKKFTWERTAMETIKIYEDLLRYSLG